MVVTPLKTRKNTRRKIGVFVTTVGTYPENIGGAEMHVYYSCNRLSELGHRILVVTPATPFLGTRISDAKTSFTKYPLRLWRAPFSALSYVIKSLLLGLSVRKQVNIVHAHVADYPMLAAFLISLFTHTPFTVTCHGSDIRVHSRKWSQRMLQTPLLRRARGVFAVSSEIVRILVQEYGVQRTKIHLTQNGYDDTITAKLVSIQTRSPVKKQKVIICAATMRPEKDHMTLLRGFARLTKKVDRVQLLLAGDGPLRAQLEEYSTSEGLHSVKFLGKLPHENLLRHISRSDFFVLSSVEEGMPTAIIEALALGKPVVATRVGGIPEVVKDGKNGILVPPRSPEKLAKALGTLLTDVGLRTRLGQGAAESVQDYSWTTIAGNYEKVYLSMVSAQDEV